MTFPHSRPVLTRQSRWSVAALCLLMLFTSPVTRAAGDGGLYGPAAPPGSAFIRVFNASDADFDARVGNETLSDVGAWQASDFAFLPAGSHTLSAGAASQSVDLSAGRYYTAVVGKSGVQLVNDDNSGNRLKALLILYNMAGTAPLSLRTQDGKTVVVPDVARGVSGKREVNPTKVQLAVYAGDTKLADAPPVALARGQAFSLFVVGEAAAPRLVWTIN